MMGLENSLIKIKDFILKRYKDNLVAVLMYGSANTGHYKKGKSDIDFIIILKEFNGLNISEETKFLIEELKSENFRTQYFHTLNGIKKYIQERVSWSTLITIISNDGSRKLYSTREFEELKKWFLNNFPSKKEIKKYIRKKDNYELYGYFKEIKNFELTKALTSHVRRKLQIINYFQTKKLIFDYLKCLENINLNKNYKEKLKILYNIYDERKKLSEKQIKDYYKISEELTKKILEY